MSAMVSSNQLDDILRSSRRIHTSFRPFVLHGHNRPITCVKYNAEGDLVFSGGKDGLVCLWSSENGEQIGVYTSDKSHAVSSLDVDFNSKYLITACGDSTVKLYRVNDGTLLYSFSFTSHGPVRSVSWADGSSNRFAMVQDQLGSTSIPQLRVCSFPDNKYDEIQVKSINFNVKGTVIAWTRNCKHIICANEKGELFLYDPDTLECQLSKCVHDDRIVDITFNSDKTLMVTSSRDCTAKLIDPVTFDVLKTYHSNVPVNGAVISPTHPHIILGGGQDARDVTTTSASQGKFEAKFHHLVFEENLGFVKGHFGPINALAIHPKGESYISGSEDGILRLHHFESSYLESPSNAVYGIDM